MNLFVIGRRPASGPPGWGCYRTKDVTTYVNRGVAPLYSDEDTGVIAFSQKCIRADRTINISAGRAVVPQPGLLRTEARLRAGDVVVNSTGTGTLGRVGAISADIIRDDVVLVADGHVTILRTRAENVLPRFLWYMLSTDAFYDVANVCLAVGSTNQMELGRESIRQLGMALPSLDEQFKIVTLLDLETARIDRLVSEVGELRLLIIERRMAEIDRLIEHGGLTNGLVPVESPWLDAVPPEWQLMPLKRCVDTVTVGIVVNPSHYYEDEGVPVLRGLNIRPGRVGREDLVFMSEESNDYHAKSRLIAGDVVVVRTGAAGSAAVVPDWAVGGNIVDLLLVRPGPRMRPKFVELLLNSRLVQRQVLYGSVGALQAHFNTGALSNVVIVAPPLPEQDRVLDHLQEHLGRYDALIAEAEQEIDLLREHRQAVIAAAVSRRLDSCREAS